MVTIRPVSEDFCKTMLQVSVIPLKKWNSIKNSLHRRTVRTFLFLTQEDGGWAGFLSLIWTRRYPKHPLSLEPADRSPVRRRNHVPFLNARYILTRVKNLTRVKKMTRVKILNQGQNFDLGGNRPRWGRMNMTRDLDEGWYLLRWQLAIVGVLVDGPGRNSFDDGEVYVGASDGVYVDRFHVGILELVNCLLVQCRHTSIVPVNCNGLERARRRGDIATSVLVLTARQYQRYYRISNRWHRCTRDRRETSREKEELGVYWREIHQVGYWRMAVVLQCSVYICVGGQWRGKEGGE